MIPSTAPDSQFNRPRLAGRARRLLITCAALACALPALAQQPAPAKPDAAFAAAIDGAWRAADNRARDQYRHPAATLAFFGVQDDSTLIEITPGRGWYTEILAPALRDRGHYVAAVVAPQQAAATQRDYQQKNLDALRAKLDAEPALYDKATIVEFNPAAPVFGAPGSADVVVTFRNAHNWVQAGNADVFFKAFFAVLKPGGVLGVVDHRAKAGSAPDIKSGYLQEQQVVTLATAAGFRLDAKSEINANPKDTADHPRGVWTLPPVLALGEQDKARYLAIGESDRFTLRFVKPGR